MAHAFINAILTGAIGFAYGIAALFFLRFWRDTGDRLFAFFSVSFVVLAVNRVAIAIASAGELGQGDKFYWVRFCAFVLILAAILDKNRSRS